MLPVRFMVTIFAGSLDQWMTKSEVTQTTIYISLEDFLTIALTTAFEQRQIR